MRYPGKAGRSEDTFSAFGSIDGGGGRCFLNHRNEVVSDGKACEAEPDPNVRFEILVAANTPCRYETRGSLGEQSGHAG
jgi:hypothetical protein